MTGTHAASGRQDSSRGVTYFTLGDTGKIEASEVFR